MEYESEKMKSEQRCTLRIEAVEGRRRRCATNPRARVFPSLQRVESVVVKIKASGEAKTGFVSTGAGFTDESRVWRGWM